MSKPIPPYFFIIKNEAIQRWEQLEKFPDLAAPWHLLFSQIQNPRVVVSELLQNADDVGATWASISFKEGNFIFQHNGMDFDENNLRSLCRFGYSNKRTLHTIGFRGIGFKSTFSLGPSVEVYSPSLSISFHKKRFTEPVWIKNGIKSENGITTIKVQVDEPKITEHIVENIQWWIKTPLPLLFFNNIKQLTFEDQIISKEIILGGPIPNSNWISINSDQTNRLLLVTSPEEDVPKEALEEIRAERMETDFTIPPCKVELIIGLEQQYLYEILPTNISLQLPFSANAPFIQDPVRTGIKDPLRSPMNRWLLERIGKLAISTMLGWLSNNKLSKKERVEAYSLLPLNQKEYANSVSGYCEKAISSLFQDALEDQPVLITSKGKLSSVQKCLNIDPDLLKVWTEQQLIALFDESYSSVIAGEVNSTVREVLIQWGLLERRTHSETLTRLTQKPIPPKPGIYGIKELWLYISKHLNKWDGRYYQKSDLQVVPIKGKKFLYPSNNVNVLSSKEKQLTEEEFSFLQEYLIILDPEWLKLIKQIQADLKTKKLEIDKNSLILADLFEEFGLDQGITIEKIFNQAAEAIFSLKDPGLQGIRIAQIASRLGIVVSKDFQFLCRDNSWRKTSEGILPDDEACLELLYPQDELSFHQISDQYVLGLDSKSLRIWKGWVKQNEKSQLRKFLLPNDKNFHIYNKPTLLKFFQQRNSIPPTEFPLKNENYWVKDSDFSDELWQYWEDKAKTELNIWVEIVKHISYDWGQEWEDNCFTRVFQEGSSYCHNLNHGDIYAIWLGRLRNIRCIPDTYSQPRFPSDLLRSTSETAALIQVESFVNPDFDKPENIPLMDLLGVRKEANDPSKVIDRLKALSHAPISLKIIQEATNLFDALDRIVLRLGSKEIEDLSIIFQSNPLILSNESSWHSSKDIFQDNHDQIPGIPSIISTSANLNMWERLKVPRQPTIEIAIHWLNMLINSNLSELDIQRIKAISKRYPEKVWIECRHWLNLEEEWQSCNEMHWGVEKPESALNLFSWVRQETADLSMLENTSLIFQLGEIIRLDNVLEYRYSDYHMSRYVSNPDWIRSISENMLKVTAIKERDFERGVELNKKNIQDNAKRLSETRWLFVSSINVTPYINGQPAGYHSDEKAIWNNLFLLVLDDGMSNHREVVNAIVKDFIDPSIKSAINDCIGRESDWIDEYFSGYFELGEINIPDDIEDDGEDGGGSGDDGGGGDNGSGGIDGGGNDDAGDDDTSDDEGYDGGDGAGKDKNKRKKSLRSEEKFSLFITTENFTRNQSNKSFINSDRHRIIPERGVFPWVEYNSGGEEICRYRLEEGVLETGLELSSEVWETMKQLPDICCLVIHNEKNYQKFRWKDLEILMDQKRLRVTVANYLLKKLDDSSESNIG